MRWRDRQGSENVEDRRGQRGPGGFRFPFPGGRGGFPGGGRFPIPTGRGGGVSIITILILFGLMLLFGIDPRVILGGDPQSGGIQVPGGGESGGSLEDILRRREQTGANDRLPFPRREQAPPAEDQARGANDDLKQFVSVVLADTEKVWTKIFADAGRQYDKPALVLFRGSVASGCGAGVSQMGPFYCPLDGKVYLDLSFYEQLKSRFRAPGDFAQAYVIAHEVGHHVQTLLGITERVARAKRGANETEANAVQVRMELQADCLAGLWAHEAQKTMNILEEGDIDEALNAASAIGDDRQMRRTTGVVIPESFTHGSSEQRVRWFRRGFETGQFSACDTFKANSV